MAVAAEDWKRVEQLLDLALGLPEPEREPRVRAACGTDAALCAEVLSLLRAERSLGAFMEPVERRGTAADAPAADGQRLGAWRIMRLLGRGGMGEVYLVERADGQFAQHAALKIAGTRVAQDSARFYAERQILAALTHPGIARLLDGGLSADDRPFMVMEYVEGADLMRHCAQRAAGLDERLRLFGAVCEATAYAHRHLVVHRDLKPGNILVSADGQPKLLDFGVAKLLDPARPAGELTQSLRLTPTYAAPEQLEGGATTTATDVYALGVILYELLTGAPPWRLSELPLASAISRVLLDEPPPPSRAVQPALAACGIVARTLRGDLDAIVGKALRREPEKRYASAGELLADLQRHARGEPVTARAQSLRYVASRFVRRHRIAVGAGAAVIVALVAGLALSLTFYVQARAERDRAEVAARTAQAVNDFLNRDLLASARLDRAPTRDLTLRELLDSAAAQVDDRFAAEPETALRVHESIADSYLNLSMYEASRRHRERALALAERLHGRDSDVALELIAKLGTISGMQGRYTQSLALLDEARRGLERRHGPGDARLITLRVDAADTAFGAGLFQRAIDELGGLLDTPAQNALLSAEDRLDALGRLGSFHMWNGDLARAEALQRESAEGREKLLGPDHLATAVSRLGLALVLIERGALVEAEALVLPAHAAVSRWVGPDDAFLALAESTLARLRMEQGRPQEAERSVHNALRIRTAAFGAESSFVAWTRYNLADCLRRQGRLREALRLMEEVLPIADSTDGPGNPFTVKERLLMASILRELGDTARARATLDAIPQATLDRLPPQHPFVESHRSERRLLGLV
ncbi:MAG: serine/threonine-protein kinase [Sinimarinibacterium sp.]|jgi:tetratricopeptide (TPR) repeat protein/predicted Ser/Thr protein kinase